MKVGRAVIAGGLAVALVVLAGCGDDSSGNGDAARGSDAQANTASARSIGEPARLGDVEVTVHGFRDPFDSGNAVVQAPPGSRQVAVEVEVKNLGKEADVFSPFKQFELRDSTNKSFTAVPLPRTVPAFNGGDAPPGSAQRGLIAFNVPAAATGLQLVFENPLITEGSLTYNLP